MGIQRRRRRARPATGADPTRPEHRPVAPPGGESASADSGPVDSGQPSPAGLAERPESSATTSAVHDPDPTEPLRAGAEALTAGAQRVGGAPGEAETATAPRAAPGKAAAAARRSAGRKRPDPKRADSAEWEPGQDLYRLEPDDMHTERGLRGLVGSGSSQVGVTAAMRARDAARPTDADLAAAEANLAIIRRGWVPREDLPRPGR